MFQIGDKALYYHFGGFVFKIYLDDLFAWAEQNKQADKQEKFYNKGRDQLPNHNNANDFIVIQPHRLSGMFWTIKNLSEQITACKFSQKSRQIEYFQKSL